MGGGCFTFFFGIDRGGLYMVFFLESGPRAMEPGLVRHLCPIFGTCVRDRACGDWLDVFYIEREGTAPGGRSSGTFFSPRAGVND